MLRLQQARLLQISMQKQRLRQKNKKRSKSINIIHVLTTRKRQKKFFYL